MSVFCLVHGSTQSSACWKLLANELAARGHKTVVVNLPADEPEASATRYAEEIARALPRNSAKTIVVAHSVSGLFLPLVPRIVPVRHLVFLASLIPRIGLSVMDQFQASPDMLNPVWVGKNPATDDEAAMRFLFHDCPPEVLPFALASRRLMYAEEALTETCPLSEWPETPCSYIVCAEDRSINPHWSRQAAREFLSVEPIELPGGHCPHISRPAKLADALEGLPIPPLNPPPRSSRGARGPSR